MSPVFRISKNKIRLLKKRKKRKRKNLVLTDGTSLTSSRSVIIHKEVSSLEKQLLQGEPVLIIKEV